MAIEGTLSRDTGVIRRRAPRFWEVDTLRGVAIVCMVVFHTLFDLDAFGPYAIDLSTGFWRYFERATAALFILLVGVSLVLSSTRARRAGTTGPALFTKYARRGLTVLGWGLGISLVTWLLFPDEYVRFGILHLIGVAIVLAYPFLELGSWNLPAGLLAIGAGVVLQGFTVGFPWLLWLGLAPRNFTTLDYFPLLPWFGVTLLGLFLGDLLYRRGLRGPGLDGPGAWWPIRGLRFLGRHSLLIYLVHQPLLLLGLGLVGVINLGAFA